MRSSAFLYPWDVVGDPAAPGRLAALGVQQATLAAAYHSTRAVTPRHPGHRIVTAPHSAVYYPIDPARWAGHTLAPAPQRWCSGADPWGDAAEALAAAGLEVHSWVVLAHNSLLGATHPGRTVVNAHGDRYPWAPCIADDQVRAYCARLAAEAAVRPGAAGTELESCGWYGLAHLHAHDKIAGVPLDPAAQYLLSLCFCDACARGYQDAGVAPERLRAAVVRALEPVWAGTYRAPDGADTGAAEWAGVEKLLGADLAAATMVHRRRALARFQEEVVGAVRQAAPPGFRVLLHADPVAHRTGSNTGVDADRVLALVDGLVLPCTGDAGRRAATLEAAAAHRRPGTVLAANLTVVSGMGGSPATLAEDARHAAAHGAGELRLYHAGLAGDGDLALVRDALARLRG
ncbi:hypothetical protein [Peterkaempfera griseoplana]|uniref:hypothetical protein n=1 Tax=Peterkaempfera griseoplana TaxID=66896 RepID=UPI0006E31C8F|nr:hypothetical protein [Peterkaempfera griseoplana]